MNSSWGRDQCAKLVAEDWSPLSGEFAMANDDTPRKPRSADKSKPRARPQPTAPEPRPFDMWLQKQLHAMYDEIASEPLPGDLLKLIDSDAERTVDVPQAGAAEASGSPEANPGKPTR